MSCPNNRRSPAPNLTRTTTRSAKRHPSHPRVVQASKAQRLEWLLQADAFLIPLVRSVTAYDDVCDADVDDIAQTVRIRLVDDLERFDPAKGSLITFVRLRALWEAKAYRRRPTFVFFDEEVHDEECAPDAEELHAQELRERMTSEVFDDVKANLSPLEADAVMSMVTDLTVEEVMKKHGVKRRWVFKKREIGLAKMNGVLVEKWALEDDIQD